MTDNNGVTAQSVDFSNVSRRDLEKVAVNSLALIKTMRGMMESLQTLLAALDNELVDNPEEAIKQARIAVDSAVNSFGGTSLEK